MVEWKRARTPKQKALREQTILKAAEDLFTQRDYQEVSLNAIARKAGFAKSNVYRYFSTREEIFLQIFFNSFESWAEELTAALYELEIHAHSRLIAQTWVWVTVRHKGFLDLSPFLYVALERNCSEDALLRFDASMDVPVKKVEQAVQRVIPSMSSQSAFSLMLYFHALSSGLWPLSQNHEIWDRVWLKRNDPSRRIEYEERMTGALEMIIQGLRNDTDEQQGH
jgi:TetR/AcrR family transcriptional regulator